MEAVQVLMDNLWVAIGAILVFFMLGGFILLEAGSTRMKNAGHVAGKTIFTAGIGTLVFWAVGYGFIYGEGNAFIGLSNFFYGDASAADGGLTPAVDFSFQVMFALVSLTIAFGGFAERAKLGAYVIFAVLFSAFIYPVVAHWIWGGGWLAEHGKQDFAGSTVVHLTGAMAALAATMILKPRIGKYNKNGTSNNLAGHNQVYTTLGVLILWVGWFGFNGASTFGVSDGFLGYVILNTQLAAAAGAVAAMFTAWAVTGKADIPTTLNGALAGLVAITASCGFVAPWAAVIIGLVGGLMVVFSMKLFDGLKLDDPIAALSVHGTVGVWGTLSNGLFALPALSTDIDWGQAGLFYGGGWEQLGVQTLGVVASGIYAFVVSFIILKVMDKVMGGLRVTEEEEIMGLDISEHGSYGYPEQMALEQAKLTTAATKEKFS
ncbi:MULTISPECIES: ammonium transporter [Lysinibacillus]|uniref:Ammonium transporter n=1 Tax=Lysinibacillus antri TaxID=2498145 RepID=A0A3S0PAA9_9BACI|nr:MULTISPECIES: ammonium transporter [Lysinibacillus]RUL56877.1 ammonium transporter [Lysinibacillus antri]TSI08634.1 ammonium transporter [Lysinibacillus sp. BW-2-10]